MQKTVRIDTPAHNGLYDITRQVESVAFESGIQAGMVNVYAHGATAAIMIQSKSRPLLYDHQVYDCQYFTFEY